jgi:hypothetical protein
LGGTTAQLTTALPRGRVRAATLTILRLPFFLRSVAETLRKRRLFGLPFQSRDPVFRPALLAPDARELNVQIADLHDSRPHRPENDDADRFARLERRARLLKKSVKPALDVPRSVTDKSTRPDGSRQLASTVHRVHRGACFCDPALPALPLLFPLSPTHG